MPSPQVCTNRCNGWWRYDSFICLSFHQTCTSCSYYNDFAERNTDSCSDYAMDAAESLYWFGFCVTIQYASNTPTSWFYIQHTIPIGYLIQSVSTFTESRAC
eukprot:976612_1